MPKRRKPQRVLKQAQRTPPTRTTPAVPVQETLNEIIHLARDGGYHAAWTLAGSLPPLPGADALRAVLRLYARDVTGALDDLTLLVQRVPALREVLARLRRADPAQLEEAFGNRYGLGPWTLPERLQRDPGDNLEEQTYGMLLDLVQQERKWKETLTGQTLPDDAHDWVLLREMLSAYPSPRNTGWVYLLRDTQRFIREVRDATGAPERSGLPAPVYTKLMYAAVETGDLETGEGLLTQSDWNVAPNMRRYVHAVLLGRAALLRGDPVLVTRAIDVARTVTGKVGYTELSLTNRLYPQLLAAAAALQWRLPGYEQTVRTVLEDIVGAPWRLDLVRDAVSDLTGSRHPRWNEDELNVSQEFEYLPPFEAAITDPTIPADLRGLCALLTDAVLPEQALTIPSDERHARTAAAWNVAQAFSPDTLWLHHRHSARGTGHNTPDQLHGYAIWGAAALRAGDTPDPMVYRLPRADPPPADHVAEIHRVLMDWPQHDPHVRQAGEILRRAAWDDGGWPEDLETHDLYREGHEAAAWRLNLDPEDPELLFLAGLRAHQAGLAQDARTHYQGVLRHAAASADTPVGESDPHGVLLPTRINLALLDQGDDPAAARAHLDAALALDPGNEKALRLKEQLTPKAPKAGKRAATGRTTHAPDHAAPAPGSAQDSAFLRSASARYPAVQPAARKLLGVLALLDRPLDSAALAEYSGMDSVWVGRHLGTLLRAGMLTQEGPAYRLNPAIATQARLDADHVTTTRLLHAGSGQAAMPIFRSHRERLVYSSLLHLFPNQLVFPNMALQSIFAYDRMKTLLDSEDFGYYLKAIADFCVVSTVNYLPLLVLEVDSAYHDLEGAQVRDARKDRIVTQGGLSLLRVRPHGQPSEAMVHSEVTRGVQDLIRSGLAPALHLLQGGESEPIRLLDSSGGSAESEV